MNKELIDKLAEQINWGRNKYGLFTQNWSSDDDVGEIDLDKFAELIVEESIKRIKTGKYSMNTASDYYDGFNESIEYTVVKLREHFGVK